MKIQGIIMSFIIGFSAGIIPFSYLLGRLKGIDLMKIGSGNIGATNLGRVLGLQFFIIGFLLDGLKGFLPVLITQNSDLYPAFAGAGAILGHIFNPFFKFRGGKGVSTTLGVTLGLVPVPFLIALICWIIIYFLTYIVSVASMGMALILTVTTFLSERIQIHVKLLILAIGVLIIFAHRSNIKRLISKTEPKTIFWEKK
ncbi:MAG: glycerol-3-phosphate 1-O-acyltransferase PlsY [candidate division WOR-3 bacterium]|nr:glycerol-3-phosphate 1-O-acyltransferase PlsY [candidate division WOR-3 bacterium]